MTTFSEKQEIQKQYYQLEDKTIEEMLAKLPDPKYYEFLYTKDNYFNEVTDPIMIESYNNIKSDSWPTCLTFEDIIALPEHILEECRTVHKFDPLLWKQDKIDKENWNKYHGGAYPVADLIRVQSTILDNLPYIKDKKVIDLACHTGVFSLLSLHCGAKSVTVTNIRQKYLDIASECIELAGYQDKFTSLFADLHDYDLTTNLCKGADTVLLFGVLYHLYDHMMVLESIAKAQPKTIIIDQVEDADIMDLTVPMISWYVESTNSWKDGWAKDKEKVFSGMPNKVWVDTAMNLLNYVLVSHKRYGQFDVDLNGGPDKKFYRSTYVYVYQPD